MTVITQLIKFFVYKSKGHISKTQLINYLYLADLYAVKWTGKQLTDLVWYYYQSGLDREDVDRALTQMNGKEINLQQAEGGTILIRLGTQVGSIEELQLPHSLELILENIRREWAGSGTDNITQLFRYVKQTTPVAEAIKINQPESKVKLNLYREREKLLTTLES